LTSFLLNYNSYIDSFTVLLSYLREVNVQIDDASLAASGKVHHDHDEVEEGPEVQAGEVFAHPNSDVALDSLSSSSQARPGELEEGNQNGILLAPDMSREELIMALVQAREDLANKRRFDRGRTQRGPVTSSVGNVDRSPIQGSSGIRRFFSTLSTGTGRSRGSIATTLPAYDDIV
jgi:hypothetical protein